MRRNGRRLRTSQLVELEACVLRITDIWTPNWPPKHAGPQRFNRQARLYSDGEHTNSRYPLPPVMWDPRIIACEDDGGADVLLLEGIELEHIDAVAGDVIEHGQVWRCRLITAEEWHESKARQESESQRKFDSKQKG